MSVLTGRLGSSAGLGGTPQGGAGSQSTFLLPAASTGGGAFAEFKSGLGDVKSGKVTLLMLDSLVLVLVLFYIWTHRVQGGG